MPKVAQSLEVKCSPAERKSPDDLFPRTQIVQLYLYAYMGKT